MPNTSFSFVTERKQKQKKGAKTSWLGGRLSDFRNHSMNSLRSDSISCRFACLANATQESKKIPKIVHPLKTSSCGMFSRIYSRKHEARSAVIGLLLGSSKNVFEGTYGRQAFSVVGVNMARPAGAKALRAIPKL